jgi:high-affinity Fe2+/Pb2+ permease
VTGILSSAQLPRVVLAHQFGWDEILLFIAPVVLVLLGLRWFEKRSDRGGDDENADD